MPAPSEAEEASGALRRKLYGRRKGQKLSAHQTGLLQALLPRLKVQVRNHADPRSYFDQPVDDVWLEIGFGAGEHLLWQAERNQNVGMIGAEPNESGVAKLLSKLSALETQDQISRRLKVYTGDARDIIEALPDASLGRVFLLFPDPWPKKRHHKRRFIQMEMLDALARVMKPGAELRFASDNPAYIAWTLERISTHQAFVWLAQRPGDWFLRPSDWPPTRYEQKALDGTPAFFRFERRKEETFVALANRALTA